METVKAISSLIDDVKPYLFEAGYKQSGITFSGKRINEATPEKQQDAITWLIGFRHGFCSKITEAKQLVPESVWKMYEITGHKGSWEQRQLSIALEMVRAEWKNRPYILRKDSKPDPNPSKKCKPKKLKV